MPPFGHVERKPIDSVVRRVDQMKDSKITKCKGCPRKTISKYLQISELNQYMVYD